MVINMVIIMLINIANYTIICINGYVLFMYSVITILYSNV